MYVSKLETVTYQGYPATVQDWRAKRRTTSLRVCARRWTDVDQLMAKVIEGDGRLTDCVVHVPEHDVTPDQLRALITEWIGPADDLTITI